MPRRAQTARPQVPPGAHGAVTGVEHGKDPPKLHLGADPGHEEAFPVVQHGFLQQTLLRLALWRQHWLSPSSDSSEIPKSLLCPAPGPASYSPFDLRTPRDAPKAWHGALLPPEPTPKSAGAAQHPPAAQPLSYQHEVDVEVEDLVAHVHAVGVGEVIPQVGEGPGSALEVGARNLHALGRQENASGVHKPRQGVAVRSPRARLASEQRHSRGQGDKIQFSGAKNTPCAAHGPPKTPKSSSQRPKAEF